MPPPRQPRLASRKSVVTDRTLYEQPADDSDVSPPPKHLPRAAKYPPPAASSSANTIFAQPTRRRSTRLSTESTATDSPAPPPTKLRQPPLSRAKNATKSPAPVKDKRKEPVAVSRTRPRVEVEQDADDEGDHDDDEGVLLAKPTPARKSAGGNKRQKVAPTPAGEVGLATAPTTRAGFVPRAAARASKVVKPQPEYTHVVANESAEDSEPLAFTTHPPTPHAAGKGKRVADKAAVNPRQKASRTGRADPAPQASTSRLPSAASPSAAISTTPPRSTNAPHYVAPITTAETPKQLSNREMRSNLGIGTPGTGRRPSMEMRGRRGSSIGGGFEATPHPFVDNDKLYRSTDATKPVAVRLRALISWTAQRQREELFSPANGGASTDDDATKRFAKEVIDDFIMEICESRLDVSVANSANAIPDAAELPPHPQNVVNEAKLAEVQEHYAAIQRESNSRADVLEKYSAFGARRTAPAPSTSALSIPDLAVFNSPLPVPSTYEESVVVGQSLLSGEVGSRAAKTTSKKGKGKEVAPTATGSAMDAMTATLADVRLQSANFRRLTHRIGEFSRISTSYVSTRIQQAHQALSADSLRGLSNVPVPVVSSDTGPLLGGIAGVVRALTPTTTTAVAVGPGPEPRDLLRAIAGADHRSRNGGGP